MNKIGRGEQLYDNMFTTDNGVEVFVRAPEHPSDKRPVILLPGAGTGPEHINQEFLDTLASDRQIYVPDIVSKVQRSVRNLGVLAIFNNAGSMEHYANETRKTIYEIMHRDSLGQPPDGIGYSWGGTVIDKVNRDSPGSIHRIVTISTPQSGITPNTSTQLNMAVQAVHEISDTKESEIAAASILGINVETYRKIKHETSFRSSIDKPSTYQQNLAAFTDYILKMTTVYSSLADNRLAINGENDPIAKPGLTAERVIIDSTGDRLVIPMGATALAIINRGHPLPSTDPHIIAKIAKAHLDGLAEVSRHDDYGLAA